MLPEFQWCWGLGVGVASGTGGPAGLAPPLVLQQSLPVSVVVAGSGGPGQGVALPLA